MEKIIFLITTGWDYSFELIPVNDNSFDLYIHDSDDSDDTGYNVFSISKEELRQLANALSQAAGESKETKS